MTDFFQTIIYLIIKNSIAVGEDKIANLKKEEGNLSIRLLTVKASSWPESAF